MQKMKTDDKVKNTILTILGVIIALSILTQIGTTYQTDYSDQHFCEEQGGTYNPTTEECTTSTTTTTTTQILNPSNTECTNYISG